MWRYTMYMCTFILLALMKMRYAFLYLPGNISRSASGLKKVSSGYPGQVDFPARQVASHSHLPDGQGPKHVVHQGCQQVEQNATIT